jgi:uncharacterized protein YhaN
LKILRLDLRAFGPFTDVSLDLSGGSQGLHLIYGPNEAGKTSALRALGQLLYGIPGNSSDNFLHPYPKLRVGAELAGRDGARLTLLRRKGTKNTLLAADDQTPLPDTELRAMLGGCDQAQFEAMFGINHPALVAGGQEILRGHGEVGHVLFAAGAGIADLRNIQDTLQRDAEDIFKPGGSKPLINQALAALSKTRQVIRESQLPSAEWIQHDKALRETNHRLGETDARLQEVSREKNRLGRIAAALPVIVKRKQLLARLQELGDAPTLAADFAEQRRQAMTQLALAKHEHQAAGEQLQSLDKQIAALDVPESLFAHDVEIDALAGALGSYRKAQRDCPGLAAQRTQLQRNAETILRQVRPDLSLDSAEQIALTTRQRGTIRRLCREHPALSEKLAQGRSKVRELEAALAAAEIALSESPPPQDIGPLREALHRAQSHGDLEQRLAEENVKLQTLADQAAISLQALGLWSGSLDDLEKLAAPGADTIDRFDHDFSQAEQEVARLSNDLQAARREMAVAERQIEELRLEGDVPTEADLAEARRVRDWGWRLVLQSWQQGGASREETDAFGRLFLDAHDLADAFPRAVRAADDLADRLRREANRVARLAALQTAHHSWEKQITQCEDELAKAHDERQHVQRQWLELWQPLGIVPLSAREMANWSRQRESLAQKAAALRVQQGNVRQWAERIETCRQHLAPSLAEAVGPAPCTPHAPREVSLAELMDRAQAAVDRLGQAASRHEQLRGNVATLRTDLAAARDAVQVAETEATSWQQQWAVALEPLALPAETPPSVAEEIVEQVNALVVEIGRIGDVTTRIDGIEHDAAQFCADVRQLALKVAPELAEQPPEPISEQMIARLQKARADRNTREALVKEHRRQEKKQQSAQAIVDEMTSRLATLCAEAGCTSAEALPQVEAAAAEAARLRADLRDRDEELVRLSAGAAIEAFAVEAAAIDPDVLPDQLRQLDEQTVQLQSERDALRDAVAAEKIHLAGMDPNATAAEAAEEKQNLLAGIQSDAEQYLRLRLATALLREGIDRYRKKNEGPVLGRAGELFRRLTLGSFAGLRIDFDDRGEQVLAGVRPGGEVVLPAAMSDGATDQLYLALRLASLEAWLARNEPMPFVVDDILIRFDNRRSAATLEVLAELSRATQVIFFTHHAHLVELARECVAKDVLLVHDLSA